MAGDVGGIRGGDGGVGLRTPYLPKGEVGAYVWPYTRNAIRLNTPHEPARQHQPSQGEDRPFGLSARLPVDLRARRRAARPTRRIGRVHGAKDNSYTAGVICAKVARYAERIHHPDRLLKPLVRAGAKGEGSWKEASWEAALDLVAEKFIAAEEKLGSETVWPYFYAGTMGLVQRDGIERLRHAKKYSGFFGSICTNLAWTGWYDGGRARCAAPTRARWRSPIASSSGAPMPSPPRST